MSQPLVVGQMCWRREAGNSRLVLHVQEAPNKPWRPYHTTPYKVADYNIPGGSKGWATYQRLRKLGWELIATPKEEHELLDAEAAEQEAEGRQAMVSNPHFQAFLRSKDERHDVYKRLAEF